MSQQTPTKAAIIQETLLKNPDLGPSAVADLVLKENKHIKVCKSQEVSTVKSKMRAEGLIPPKGAKKAGAAKTNGAVTKMPETTTTPQVKDELPAFAAIARSVQMVGWQRAKEILEAVRLDR